MYLGNVGWPLSGACCIENVQWPDDFEYYKYQFFRILWRGSPCCTVLMSDVSLDSMYFCPSFLLFAPITEVHLTGLFGKPFCLFF